MPVSARMRRQLALAASRAAGRWPVAEADLDPVDLDRAARRRSRAALMQRRSVVLPLPDGPMIADHLAASRRRGRRRRSTRRCRTTSSRPRMRTTGYGAVGHRLTRGCRRKRASSRAAEARQAVIDGEIDAARRAYRAASARRCGRSPAGLPASGRRRRRATRSALPLTASVTLLIQGGRKRRTRLRQDHIGEPLREGQADRLGCFHLAVVDGLQRAARDLDHLRGREQRQREHRRP